MGLVAFLILGLLAGAVVKAVSPGRDPAGLAVTMAIAVVGAVLGGYLASRALGIDAMQQFFDVTTWVTAVAGSLLVLSVYRMLARH